MLKIDAMNVRTLNANRKAGLLKKELEMSGVDILGLSDMCCKKRS